MEQDLRMELVEREIVVEFVTFVLTFRIQNKYSISPTTLCVPYIQSANIQSSIIEMLFPSVWGFISPLIAEHLEISCGEKFIV